MKIGILTFHSQLNYGGVLQCWALKSHLESLGYEVVVIDKWMDPENRELKNRFVEGVSGIAKALARGFLGCGDLGLLLRTIRTVRFVKRLGLTDYSFYEWRDAPSDLSVDLVVVGSDQVWNPTWTQNRLYLMIPVKDVKRISYAASFAVPRLPSAVKEIYRNALSRFYAISCREPNGVEICRDLGLSAQEVVDPVLLIDPVFWERFEGEKKDRITCYFLDARFLDDYIVELELFARTMRVEIDVLVDGKALKRIPKSVKELALRFAHRKVRVRRSYGPREFLYAISSSKWVITDSFHALMFSAIYSCDVRFLLPADGVRKDMFVRVEDFAEKFSSGALFSDNLEGALSSIQRNDHVSFDQRSIAVQRDKSARWLLNALRGVEHER